MEFLGFEDEASLKAALPVLVRHSPYIERIRDRFVVTLLIPADADPADLPSIYAYGS
jgi:hypothetical protein